MTLENVRLPSRRRRVARLLTGSLLEMGIKAYGAGAALSVALSDAETVRGKGRDAIAAVPSLSEEYRHAKYVVDHREEIRSAIDYLNVNTPPQAELTEAANRSAETLRGIETTYTELQGAKDSAATFPPRLPDVWDHLRAAWSAKPDQESLKHLTHVADQMSPLLDEVQVLTPVYYGGVLSLMDNFSSDEIASTVLVMALAFALSLVLGHAVGFWVRRGRPGLIARFLQGLGARVFNRWYVDNLPYALSPTMYSAARERIQRDILADPQGALSPEAFGELESYFARRSPQNAAPSDHPPDLRSDP